MIKRPISLFAFFRYILKPHRKWFCLSLCTRLVWAIETSTTPYVLKYIIDTITIFGGDPADIIPYVTIPTCIYIVLWIIRPIYFRLWDYVNLKMYTSIRRDVTMHTFSYLTGHSHEYFQNNFAGSLQNKISDLTDGTADVVKKTEEGIGTLMMISIAVGTMALTHRVFALILGGWFLSFIGISWLFSGTIQKHSRAFSKARTQHIGSLVDSITNTMNTRLFSKRAYENDRISKVVDNTVHKDRIMQWAILKLRGVWDITIVSMMVLMLLCLIFMYSRSEVTIGDFTLVMMLTVSVFHSVWWFVSQVVELSERLGKCKQALSILNTPHEVIDKHDAQPLKVTNGEIAFQDVTFCYEKGKNIFEKKNVTIASGEKIGLVGFSGSGKTTFVNLLLRLFDIQEGTIKIDGQDIKEVTQASLRTNISMIPQDTSLFHRNLMDNIRYGKTEATDEQVMEASKQAYCHEFIVQLSKQYDTLVGERGIKLSGGQRQRIAVARAILKDAPILILDEATSALDSVTEKYIQDSLNALMKGRTTIVIAHRLSTLAEMDRILVFAKGKIIEQGNHETLLAKKGQYARMWAMQAGGFLPTEEA